MRPYLRGSTRPLTESYDVALLDLDGVVYLGPEAIPGVPETLAAARKAGMRLAFVTNNAARTPAAVAEHLSELGIAARSEEVVTSAQAAAHYLADRLPPGAHVLVVGTTGLQEALRERGLEPVHDANGEVAAVVQGYSPDMNWRLLAEGAVAINRGVPWVATNLDPTVPSPRGPLPGNGSLVAALRHATGARPVVTGKPDPTMHRESVQRSRARQPIVVGDRLDTDIEGANAAGCASLLVLTGVTTAGDLLAAPPPLRPTFVAADLGGLLSAHPEPESDYQGVRCGPWQVTVVSGVEAEPSLMLRCTNEREAGAVRGDAGPARSAGCTGAAGGTAIDLDPLRALCVAFWETGAGETGAHARVRAADQAAAGVLERLGLEPRSGH